MGIFDTVRALLPCDHCGQTGVREVQFKHPGAFLEVCEIGDFVPDVPVGQVALGGGFGCACGEEETVRFSDRAITRRKSHYNDAWVHFDNGFLTDVTRARPVEPTRADLYLYQRLGRRARTQRSALRRVANLCAARRRSVAEGPPDEDTALGRFLAIHDLASEEELLEGIEEALEGVLPGRRGEEE